MGLASLAHGSMPIKPPKIPKLSVLLFHHHQHQQPQQHNKAIQLTQHSQDPTLLTYQTISTSPKFTRTSTKPSQWQATPPPPPSSPSPSPTDAPATTSELPLIIRLAVGSRIDANPCNQGRQGRRRGGEQVPQLWPLRLQQVSLPSLLVR